VEGGQLAWSPDGTLLAIGTRASVVLLAPLSEAEARVFAAPSGWENPSPSFGAVAFSPDGAQVAGGFTVVVPVWDVASGDLVHEHHNVSGEVTSVAYSPDGQWIAASGARGGFVSPSTTTIPSFWIDSAPEVTWSVTFSPDSTMLASSGPSIQIWHPSTGASLRHISGSGFQLAFSPDGKMLAHGTNLWDPATGDLLRTIEPAQGVHQTSLAFDPSGDILALGFNDGTIQFLDSKTGESVHMLAAHGGSTLGLAFSPDGRLLASIGSDPLLHIWGIRPGS
jgi:WD40 repeat protein